MTSEPRCPIQSPDLSGVEVVHLDPEGEGCDFRQAEDLARKEAEGRFDEYLLLSWYDRDRDYESPAHTSECSASCQKDGYIRYGLSHGARLMIDIDNGRFVFFFAPADW